MRRREAREYHRGMEGGPPEGAYKGWHKCHAGTCPCDCASIYLQPCCGGCCLWGIWCVYGVPVPVLSCVTACLCARDTRYVAEKAGIETGELLVVDEKTKTLGMYSATSQEIQCFCTKT